MTEVGEQDFEVVDEAERKSSTSDSFENVDNLKEKATESSSEENDEEEKTLEQEEKVEEVEERVLPWLDQELKNEADKPREKDGEDLVEEMLNAPIRPDQEQFYTAKDNQRAITMLILFSAMMFTLPLLIMFSLYYWVFLDHFHYPPADAMLYSGICGAIVVLIICGLFAYTAYKEEDEAEKKLKRDAESKKQK